MPSCRRRCRLASGYGCWCFCGVGFGCNFYSSILESPRPSPSSLSFSRSLSHCVGQLLRVLQRAGAGASGDGSLSGTSDEFPGIQPRLLGDTIVASVLPSGSVFPGTAPCAVCTEMARAGFKHSSAVDKSTQPAFAEPWCCPRCCIVQVRRGMLCSGLCGTALSGPLWPGVQWCGAM